MEVMPIVKLSNGLRVANFSSPHSFKFVDGTILPACSEERARALMLNTEEDEDKDFDTRFTLIGLKFRMSLEVREGIIAAASYLHKQCDLILCPLPVLNAIRTVAEGLEEEVGIYDMARFVGIRIADRITKDCHIDKFCRW